MLKKITAILIAVLIIVLGLLVIIVSVSQRPEAILKRTLENTLDDLTEREELSLLFDILEEGSLAISVPENEEIDMSLDIKLYFDGLLSSKEPEVYVQDLHITQGDQAITGDLYISKDYLYYLNADGNAYGLVQGKMKDSFLSSPLSYGNDSKWSMPKDFSSNITTILEIYDDGTLGDIEKDLAKILKRHESELEKLLLEYVEIAIDKEEVTASGETFDGRVITVAIDESAAADIFMGLYDLLSEDDDLREKVLTYGRYFCEKLSLEHDVTKWYDEEIMKQELWEKIALAIESSNFEYTVKIVTPKMQDTACMLTVELFLEGMKEEVLSIDMGKDGIAKTNMVTFTSQGSTKSLKVEENSDSAYRLVLRQKLYESEAELMRLEIDRQAGTYTLTDDVDTYRGTFVKDGRQLEITIDQYENKYGSKETYEIRMVLNGSDRMPAPVSKHKVKPLFDMTEEELTSISDFFTGRLDGRYTGEIDSFTANLTFYGLCQVELSTTYGSVHGFYYVNNNEITIHFFEPETQSSVLNSSIYALEGTSRLTVGKDYIRIGSEQFLAGN